MRVLLCLLYAASAVTAIDFSSLSDKSWAFSGTGAGHVYGLSEVPWCYDQYHKKFVRIGGCTGGYTNEVYAYWFDASGNFVSDQILAPGTTDNNRPGAGCSRGVCYDSKRRIVWGYGGIGSPPIPCSGTNWALMGLDLSDESWRMAPGSDGYRMGECCQIEYGEGPDAIMLTGQDGGSWHQTWLYEFSKSAWRRIGAEWDPNNAASPNYGVRLTYKEVCYDPVNQCFIMYPGPSGSPKTWVFNPATMTDWEKRSPSPAPPYRERYGIAYDSFNKKVVLHGGWTGAWDARTTMTDTWTYDAASDTWTQVSNAGASRAAAGQTNLTAFDYDSEHNAFVALCMNEETGTWIFRLGSQGTAAEFALPAARERFSVFPNPIRSLTELTGVPDAFHLFSMDGRLLWNGSGTGQNLPSGTYIIRMETGNGLKTGKLTIQR